MPSETQEEDEGGQGPDVGLKGSGQSTQDSESPRLVLGHFS